MRGMLRWALFACGNLAMAQKPATVTLTVDTEVAAGGTGLVRVAIWKSEAGFPKGPPLRGMAIEMKSGKARAVFEGLSPGDYAVSAYYDRNGNGKLDSNMVGKPTEPYGFSNDARGTIGPAKFEDARLTLGKEDALTTVIHLK